MDERKQIADYLVEFLSEGSFTAPYGILSGKAKDKNGKSYQSVTFGIARTLDAEIRIYGTKFLLLRSNQNPLEKFDNIDSLKEFIKSRWDYCFSTVDEEGMIDF